MTRKKILVSAAVLILIVVGNLVRREWFPSAREPGYRFVDSWGDPGGAQGSLEDPIGIVLAGEEIFVSDSGNHRIQVFDRDGRFLRTFGERGSGPGQLDRPMHIDAREGELYVAELDRPMHIDAREGELYVAEYLNDRVQVFSLAGEPLRTVGSAGSGPGQFDAPGGVAVDGEGQLYIADFYNHRIQLLDAEGGFLQQWGTTGDKGIWTGEFYYPTDVATLPDGSLVAADAYNDRIQIFGPDGGFLRKWGGPLAVDIPGPFNGWFRVATGVTVGPAGNVFVADFYNHRIQKFSSRGQFLVAFGEKGDGTGQFELPTDVAVDVEGNLYVVDFGNNRIQKLAPIP